MSEEVMPVSEQLSPLELLEKLWKALKDHYPMMEYAGAVGDEWFEEFKRRIEPIRDLDQALPIMEELVKRLNDYHTRLEWEGKPLRLTPPIALDLVEGEIVVVDREADASVGRGDVVLEVDGRRAIELFQEAMRTAFGATKWAKIRDACRRMIEGEEGSQVRLKLSGPSKGEYEVVLRRTGFRREPEPALSGREIDGDIGYIRVARWGDFKAEDFDKLLERFWDRPYLIIDVRDNGGGSDHLAEEVVGRFIDRRVICSISFIRRPGTNLYEKAVALAEPRGEKYEGRVAVLIN
ncbi:hypothetical protein DRP77_12495, partial [Candidatus Poribacteria bacterium]